MWIRIKNSKANEIIPDYATPPIQWYSAKFASQCVETNQPDVKIGWEYDVNTGIFSPPSPPSIDQQRQTAYETWTTYENGTPYYTNSDDVNLTVDGITAEIMFYIGVLNDAGYEKYSALCAAKTAAKEDIQLRIPDEVVI